MVVYGEANIAVDSEFAGIDFYAGRKQQAFVAAVLRVGLLSPVLQAVGAGDLRDGGDLGVAYAPAFVLDAGDGIDFTSGAVAILGKERLVEQAVGEPVPVFYQASGVVGAE